MDESSAQNTVQFWSEGPQISNVDTQMMPHYKYQAVCSHEGCEETIPFTMGLSSDMRKHFNEKHRLLCKACKKEDFTRKEDLEEHLNSIHEDSFCSECLASFKLASAIAMHIENSKNSCSVKPHALASALRRIQTDVKDLDRQKDETNPNAVYSPISCSTISCSTDEKMFLLKEFRRALLRAHKEALSQKRQDITHPPSPASVTTSVHNTGRGHSFSSYSSPCESVLQSQFGLVKGASGYDPALQNKPSGLGHVKGSSCSSCAASTGSVDSKSTNGSSHHDSPRLRGDQDRFDQENCAWNCTTCVSSFTSLSKLVQHVEARVKDTWWKSMNK